MSNKYFALMEIAEKLAPDLAEDIQMYKERRREPEENSSSDQIEVDLNEPQKPKVGCQRTFIDLTEENDDHI